MKPIVNQITLGDRMRAFWRRLWPVIVALVIAMLMAGVCCLGTGCSFWRDSGTNQPTGQPKIEEHKPETTGEKVARLEGELAKAKTQHEEERLAPLRTSIAWAEGISLLGMLAGVGLAVAAMFWGLGFGWKIPAGIAAGFAGVLGACLATSFALSHVGWLVAAVIALAVLAILWASKKHLGLVDASLQAWKAVPDSVSLAPQVEELLGRLEKPKA